MNEDNLLFQIKTLEKLIGRQIIQNDIEEKIVPPTPTQMQIIECMLKNPTENIYQKDLENILNLRRATISGVLQTMEKNHLIERIGDKSDYRIKKIVLNAKAKKVFDLHMNKIEEILNNLLEGLSNNEIKQFLEIIKKMQDNLKLVVKKERK